MLFLNRIMTEFSTFHIFSKLESKHRLSCDSKIERNRGLFAPKIWVKTKITSTLHFLRKHKKVESNIMLARENFIIGEMLCLMSDNKLFEASFPLVSLRGVIFRQHLFSLQSHAIIALNDCFKFLFVFYVYHFISYARRILFYVIFTCANKSE